MSTDATNDDDMVVLSFPDDDDIILSPNVDDPTSPAATAPGAVDGLGFVDYNTLPDVQTPARSTSQRGRVSTGGGEVSQRQKTCSRRDSRVWI